ncbi:peptidyl-prolyl cis-trans isomerase FKBP16-4, chloroplastic-like [Hibiscus syriacus]|uniref:peptidyl-prolyl cis-trans isomerase FKBP16-4, chloroplastic-like n=1 Tax=Hibiscus syriacus TaxID=106335 RepID=UPI001922BED6|nr:peptidyl-prolyl cis-trans isomerase FKBP16-4, chloroplastic-like [Hibiscus syriacus]
MELSSFPYHQNTLTLLHNPFFSLPFSGKRLPKRKPFVLLCEGTLSFSDDNNSKPAILCLQQEGKRALLASLLIAVAAMYVSDVAEVVSTSRRALRGAKIPEIEFTTLPNGLKYYDLKVGSGLKVVRGSRVAVPL